MPKTAAPTDSKTTRSKSVSKPQNDYIELKVPRLRFQDTPLSSLWVLLLLVFSFLLGMSTMKLMNTQEALDTALAQGTTNGQTPPSGETLGPQVDMDAGKLPVLGDKNAKLMIVEFSDFQCPYCKRFYDETYAQLKKDYVDTGKARLAYRHMPLATHPLAQDAGEASECANEQDSFWQYHDKLFDAYNEWSGLTVETAPATFTSYATDLGLNTQAFEACLTSNKHDQTVKNDLSVGGTAGVTGTPTFFINGKPLVGAHPYATFKKLIDQELENI